MESDPGHLRSPFLTTAEGAAYLRYRSASAIRNLVCAGRLRPAGRRGRIWLFRKEVLDAIILGHGTPVARMEMHHMSKSRYPGIMTMSDGRKRIRLRAVDPRTGRMKEVDRVIEGSVEAAAALRAELRSRIKDDSNGAVQVPRLGDYAISWLRSRVVGLKASSSSRCAEVLDTYVLPYLGDFFLDRVTESDVREWQARVARGRAGATVNGALVMLRMLLEDAVDEYGLPKNPARRIRRLPVRKATDEEPNLLTGQELGRVLMWSEANLPLEQHALAVTLALTGLRYGEATALKWDDMDVAAGIIRVRRAQWHGVVSTTKTGTSRTVPMVAELGEALQKHRARLLARQVAGDIVTRSITGHVTAAMTEHYSHVDAKEKLQAVGESRTPTILLLPR